MKSKEPPPVNIKDWLLNQGPKFDDGLPLPVRVKVGKRTFLPAEPPTSAYRGVAKGLSNSDIDSEPDRF